MPFKFGAKVRTWPIFGRKFAILATIFETWTFLPIIVTDIKGQTKLEVNWTLIDHFSIQKPQKWPYLKISFAQVSITKKPTPPTFFHEFV